MTYVIIVGFVIYFFFKLVLKLADAGATKPQSIGVRLNNSSNYQDTSAYKRSLAQATVDANLKRPKSVFNDESIIEVSLESVRISYEDHYTNFENRAVHTPAYDPDEYKLGKKYKDTLNLAKQEVSWLNKLWPDRNVFNSIEGCEMEIVKLYLATNKKLNALLKKEGSSLSNEMEPLLEKTADYQRQTYQYWTDFKLSDAKELLESSVHQHIYRKAESIIRDKWNHKRKIQTDFISCGPDVKILFDEKLCLLIDKSMSKSISTIGEPDDATEIALNETGTGRWKTQFEQITNNFKKESLADTIAQLYRIGELNVKNIHVEHVYYEASKFLANQDKLESLRFYLHYIWHDLNSRQVDGKQLNKTIQKKLFVKQQELELFQEIVTELLKSKNLKKALDDVAGVYIPKRKSIKIDVNAVQLVEKQHAGTVEILSEYLREEQEPETIVTIDSTRDEEMTISIGSADQSIPADTNDSKIDFSPVQRQCLKVFEENDFTLSFESIELFAKQNGLFKNQLIDGINDRCMDLLDDVLIEEAEEGFEVNVNYHKQIFAA